MDGLGFLYVVDEAGNQTTKRIFFHANDGRAIEDNGIEPVFGQDGALLEAPRQNDILIFVRSNADSKGPKAAPWGYASEWNDRQRLLENRPVYRAVRRRQNSPDDNVVWQGQNVFELSVKHPWRLAGDECDHVSTESDQAVSGYVFEVLRGEQWHPCSDPRTVICCIPSWVFSLYAPPGMTQDHCPHRS